MSRIYDLRTEQLRTAVGIDVRHPRLSWKIASDSQNILQKNVEVTVCQGEQTVWSSGIRETRKMMLRTDCELEPASDYSWTVRAELNNGEILEAEGFFMTGIREFPTEADWIASPDSENEELIPAFRREFTPKEKPVSAKLFIAGCGVYEAYCNGKPVTHRDPAGNLHAFELKPGITAVTKRKFYHSMEISHLITEGTNCFSAIVTPGWWSDHMAKHTGAPCCLLAAVILTYADGSREQIVTDSSFRVSSEHPVLSADIYDGEVYDARRSLAFMQPGFDDSGWKAAVRTAAFTGEVESMHGEPVVCREDLCRKVQKAYAYSGAEAASEEAFGRISGVRELNPDSFLLRAGETAVIDFGQNAAGREYFKVKGAAGTTVTIRHGEMLNDRDGEKSRGNDGPGGSIYTANLRHAKAQTIYTLGSDQEEEFRPCFTFYGFRYLSITADADAELSDIRGEVLTSVGYDSGSLETGDALINQLISNGRWGMYSNYLSIPTDCPQRDERMGWTADTQVFVTAAAYYSTAAQTFLEKWGQDLRDSQAADGQYPDVAPSIEPFTGTGAVGWADAGILMPYYIWRMTGDDTVLQNQYASMKLYMDDFMASRGNLGSLERYGDWLSFEPNVSELQWYLGSCFYAYDAMVMAEMADALHKPEDAARYREVYEKQKEYYIRTYLTDAKTVSLTQQTAALYALKLGLLPDEETKKTVAKQLLDNIRANGNRLQTGFLGTAILLPTLSAIGADELAYTLLLQDAMPSWLYSVKAGATTFWERWNSYSVEDGFGDVGMNSFNHYAYGAVAEWMFGYMAGIRPGENGFYDFVLAPVPDKRIGHAAASYESVCGKIESAWHYEGDRLVYTCSVPANTTAVLTHPVTGEKISLTSGSYTF